MEVLTRRSAQALKRSRGAVGIGAERVFTSPSPTHITATLSKFLHWIANRLSPVGNSNARMYGIGLQRRRLRGSLSKYSHSFCQYYWPCFCIRIGRHLIREGTVHVGVQQVVQPRKDQRAWKLVVHALVRFILRPFSSPLSFTLPLTSAHHV